MSEKSCVICLEEIDQRTECALLKDMKKSCTHTFHRECLVAWAKAAYDADKRPISTSRSRRKPLPKCPTCRAEFSGFELCQSGKAIQLATLMLNQFRGGGGLADLDEEEEDEDEDEGDEDEDEHGELLNLFHSHYIQLEQTGWRVAENSRSSSDSRRSRTQQGHPGHSSQSRDGLRVLARSTNSKPQHLQNSVEDTMTKGASFVAKCIYEARRRTEELDLLMSSTSTSLHPPSQSTNGVVHEKCQVTSACNIHKKKKRRLSSSLAADIAESLATTAVSPSLPVHNPATHGMPPRSEISTNAVPRVKRRFKW